MAIGIILIANNWGRVKSLVLSHTLLGISCIGLAFIPKTSINAILVVYIFANIVASISKYIQITISNFTFEYPSMCKLASHRKITSTLINPVEWGNAKLLYSN